MIVTYAQSHHEFNLNDDRWTLVPIDKYGDIYVEIKLHSIDVQTTKDTILFEIKVLLHSKSILPNNIVLANAQIPEKTFNNLNLVPIKSISTDSNWTAYSINFSVNKKELSYGNQDLKELVVPIQISFYPNKEVLQLIQNQLNTNALKKWIKNLHDATFTDEVKLDSHFRIYDLSGSTSLYKSYPTQDNAGESFELRWNMDYLLRMNKLDTLSELFSFTTSIEIIISNIDINIYYHVPNTVGHKQLTSLDKQLYAIAANTTKKINFPYKVQYNMDNNELFKEPVSGHDFFLPRGGNGYYNLNFDLKTPKTFYSIGVVNEFQYKTAMDRPQLLDYFSFGYNPIYSLNGFSRV